MDFLGAGAAHHLDDLDRGRAAHDAVVHQHDALALDLWRLALCFSLTPRLRIWSVGSMKVRPT